MVPLLAQIFLSHCGDDRDVVRALYEQLARDGYGPDEVFADFDSPQLGDLGQGLLAEINACSMVLFCVSDVAVQRRWVQLEAAAAANAKKPAVFVQVGALGPNVDIRNFYQQASPYPIDWTGAETTEERALADRQRAAESARRRRERGYQRLLTTIASTLQLPAPIVVRAAILAFNSKQFGDFAGNLAGLPARAKARWTALKQMCANFGVTEATAIGELAKRYGTRAEDFVPFAAPAGANDRPLKLLVSDALERANRYRIRLSQARIYVQWLESDLLSDEDGIRQPAQYEWSNGYSLAFVDSLSTLDRDFGNLIGAVLADPDQSRSAIVWVPPHTRELARLAPLRAESAGALDRMAKWFVSLDESLDRSFAFDISDPTALQQWVHQVLRSVPSQAQALQQNVNRFKSASKLPELLSVPDLGGAGSGS